jgi:hypothetical protein
MQRHFPASSGFTPVMVALHSLDPPLRESLQKEMFNGSTQRGNRERGVWDFVSALSAREYTTTLLVRVVVSKQDF